MAQLRDLLEALLRIEAHRELELDFKRNPKLRQLFDLTGRASRAEIQKEIHLSTDVMAETWASWHQRGLVRKVGKSYEKVWRD